MSDVVNFLFYKSWADELAEAGDIEYTKDMLYRIHRYGIYHEEMLDGLDPMSRKWLHDVYHKIDVAKNNYAKKQAEGGDGRPQVYDHNEIYRLLCSGKSAADVGRQLGFKEDSIYKTEEYKAWKRDGKPKYPVKVIPESGIIPEIPEKVIPELKDIPEVIPETGDSKPVKLIPENNDIPEFINGHWNF